MAAGSRLANFVVTWPAVRQGLLRAAILNAEKTLGTRLLFAHTRDVWDSILQFHTDDVALHRSGQCLWLVHTRMSEFSRASNNQSETRYTNLCRATSSAWNFSVKCQISLERVRIECAKRDVGYSSYVCSFWLANGPQAYTVEASGHPREAEKVSATGGGRLRKCVNTEFVWARVQTGFCRGGRK